MFAFPPRWRARPWYWTYCRLIFMNCLFDPVLSAGSCSSGGFAGRHVGSDRDRDPQRCPLKLHRSSESVVLYLSDSPSIPPFHSASQQPACAARYSLLGSHARQRRHAPAARWPARAPAEPIGPLKLAVISAAAAESVGGGAGHGNDNVTNMKMDYIPHTKRKHSGCCAEVQYSKNSHKAVKELFFFAYIANCLGCVLFYFFKSLLLFYIFGEFLGVHPFCY